jgi:aryl-alcohol dehydrogenase
MNLNGKSVFGIIGGNSVIEIFIPQLVELHRHGRFPFYKLVKFYDPEQIDQAAEDREKGGRIKPIIRLQ